jgi:dTDP-glucose 4,6-dehydratase
MSYARSFELPAVILRPFNTFGPRQSSRAVIPTIVRQALAGDVVRLGSLHPTRDFLYVDDTVSGFIAAAKSDLTPGTELQIGTGVETSIGDIVRMTGQILGHPLQVQSEEQRVRPGTSEVERLVCDYSEAKRLTGWAPQVSFPEGLRRVIEWMNNCNRADITDGVHEYVI